MSEKIVAVVGAGRVGAAITSLLTQMTDYKVVIIDSDPLALDVARESGTTFGEQPDFRFCPNAEVLEAELRKLEPFAVVCCTPFHVNIPIATVCAKLNCHYVDFTEDVSVTKAVTALNPGRSTFVLQTGLAPGLVTCVGKSLLKRLQGQGLQPVGLQLRVGALPQIAEMPAAYALMWSSAGLINEYFQPVERIVGGETVIDEPLDDLEEIVVDGRLMEAFNTSGGIGALSMYEGLWNVDYKTMRYPGHLDFLQKRIVAPLRNLTGAERIAEGVKIADSLFPRTRDDVVYMVVRARAVGTNGQMHEAAFQHRFYGSHDMTALELTTAGTGAAIVELLDKLPKGIVFGGDVPLEALFNTNVGQSFLLDCMSKV